MTSADDLNVVECVHVDGQLNFERRCGLLQYAYRPQNSPEEKEHRNSYGAKMVIKNGDRAASVNCRVYESDCYYLESSSGRCGIIHPLLSTFKQSRL